LVVNIGNCSAYGARLDLTWSIREEEKK